MTDLKLYPLSSPAGVPIPLDVVRNKGVIRQDFTTSPVDDIAIPACDFLWCLCDADCIIGFDTTVTLPASGSYAVNHHLIPAGFVFVIDHNQAETLGVVGTTGAGTLWIHPVAKYKDLRKQGQFDHN